MFCTFPLICKVYLRSWNPSTTYPIAWFVNIQLEFYFWETQEQNVNEQNWNDQTSTWKSSLVLLKTYENKRVPQET
jgi:hypothetical protein